MAPTHRSVSETVARYLLYVTVGLVTLEAVVDVAPAVPLDWLAVVTMGAFVATAVTRFVDSTGREAAEREREYGQPSTRAVLATLFGLCLVGGVLRGYALGAQSFWFDEAISANAAIALIEDGRPTFPSGDTYWRGVPHTLVVAGSMAIFGTGEVAARLPSVGFGIATIGVTYWLGRDVGGNRVGLLAAALVTFATWEIAWSRQVRMYQQFQLLYTLSLVLFVRVERTWFAEWRSGIALVVVIVGAALTHEIGYVLVPVAVAYLGLAGLLDGRLSRRVAAGLVGCSLGFATVVELGTGVVSNAIERIVTTHVSYWEAYAAWLTGEFHGVFLLGIVGMGLLLYRGRHRAGLLLVIAVVAPVWVLSFYTELFATRYLYFGLPVLFLWAAVTIDVVAIAAVERGREIASRFENTDSVTARVDGDTATTVAACLVAGGIAVLLASGGGFTVAPQAAYELGPNAPQPDFAGAYDHVNDRREPGDVIVAGWTAPGVYYAGGVDYWLAHDLSGIDGDWTVNGSERYAGAEPIVGADELETVVDDHERGWIVVDEIALARQDQDTRAALDEHEVEHERGGMTVYSWDHSDGGDSSPDGSY